MLWDFIIHVVEETAAISGDLANAARG